MNVSVIILTKNCSRDLKYTLSKCGLQLAGAHQVIFKDYGSSDGTLDIIADFASANSTLVCQNDAGIANGWNQALNYVTGDWILFLNAGDYLCDDFFKKLPSDPPAIINVLFGDVHIFDPFRGSVRSIIGKKPTEDRIKFGMIGFGHPGSLIRRSALISNNLKFDEDLSIAMDFKLLTQLFLLNPTGFQKCDICCYMDSTGISTSRLKQAVTETFLILRQLDILSWFHSQLISNFIYFARKIFKLPFVFVTLRHIKHIFYFILQNIEKFLIFWFFRKFFFQILGFSIGDRSRISLGFDFYRHGNLIIGKNTVINRNCSFDNRGEIEIGNNCSISRDVKIFTAGHAINSSWGELKIKPVCIEDNVMIFSGSYIMPGVTLHKNSVVLPGSVVTKDVCEGGVVGGNPARLVRFRSCDIEYILDYPFVLAK
jgi:acetyltransferase-like isoleucine patch superfamily enzyme